jgi:hypothetical protein
LRELCSLACLAGQIVFPQFHSHLLGALNAGATLNEIRAVLDLVSVVWGRTEQAAVDGYWLDFVARAHRSRIVTSVSFSSAPAVTGESSRR